MTPVNPTPEKVLVEPSSFRDRNGRIYYHGGAVYRGISSATLDDWKKLASTNLFRDALAQGKLIPTEEVGTESLPDLAQGWAAVLKHQCIPFVSYPYEWSFSMLKDAALLQLELIGGALDEDMTLKDASSFNIQWTGAHPVFIDIASFERLAPGTPWVGYRQFCEMFLYPLMLQAYKDVPFHSWLRGNIEGIDPEEFRNLMSTRDLLRAGVFVDVVLQARLQSKYADTNRQVKRELRAVGFRKEMIKANVRRLSKIVRGLTWKRAKSVWSDYADNTSYSDADTDAKARFVRDVVKEQPRNLVWDLGCNTGRYSRIAAENSTYVVAMDNDHFAIERLYQELKHDKLRTILPLVIDLANASPNLGWRGQERKTLIERGQPDLTLALALIHHVVISANIPLSEFIDWLASLGSDLVIEFVAKDDPMTRRLLQNKDDQYDDYTLEQFERYLAQKFRIERRERLKSGTRCLFYARGVATP